MIKDVQTITNIIDKIDRVKEVINKYGVSSDNKDLLLEKYIFDLCMFYMSQLGSLVERLSDKVKDDIDKEISLSVLMSFKQAVLSDYDSIDKGMLRDNLNKVISNSFRDYLVSYLKGMK